MVWKQLHGEILPINDSHSAPQHTDIVINHVSKAIERNGEIIIDIVCFCV